MSDAHAVTSPTGHPARGAGAASRAARPAAAHGMTMDADEIARVLADANRWASMRAQFEIPPAQARLLSLVQLLQPVRITDLAAAAHSSQPGVTARVNKLVDAGLAQRVADDHDARSALVTITPDGFGALERIRAARAEALIPALEALSQSQRRDLERGIAVLAELAARPAPER